MGRTSARYRSPHHRDAVHPEPNHIPRSALAPIWAVLVILLFAVAFGGGGSKYGMANLVAQLAALVALSFHRAAFAQFWNAAPLSLKALTLASILLPLAYIIPLPADWWSALPGRELVVQSLDLIGEKGWRSASVDPVRTLLAVTALIVPLAVLTIGWGAARSHLILAGWVIVGLGLVNFLIGIPQVLTNSEQGVIYPENPMPGVLFGTFANRNSTGLFLVGALALAALLPAPARLARVELGARIAAIALLFVTIVLTRSRTALVLSLIPLALFALRAISQQLRQGRGASAAARGRIIGGIGLAALGAIAIVTIIAVAAPGRVGDVMDRFERTEDARAYIWEDASFAAERYWPIGSGSGTFDEVFQIDESLENMTVRRAGRAHNDYLEVAIEAGIPGLALIAGWLLLLAWLAWRARTSPDRWIAWSGAAILLAIAMQSATDYPLRNLSMMAIGGYALLILTRFGTPTDRPGKPQEVLP